MARYDDSWRTDVKSMFTPLPLNAMQLKLDQQQEERDLFNAQVQSALDIVYNSELVDGENVLAQQQEYDADMAAINDNISGTYDLTQLQGEFAAFQKKYNLNPGTAIQYANSTGSSGSGQPSTFMFNSDGGRSQRNYNANIEAKDHYNKENSPDSAMYDWVYRARVNEIEKAKSGGSYTNQPDMQYAYKLVDVFNEQAFDTQAIAFSNLKDTDSYAYHTTSPTDENGNVLGGYIGTGQVTYRNGTDVAKNTFEWMLADDGWQDRLETEFIYKTEKTGEINQDEYANYYLDQKAQSNLLEQQAKDKLKGNDYKITTDLIEAEKQKINAETISAIQQQYADNNEGEQITSEQAQQLLNNQWGLEGYKNKRTWDKAEQLGNQAEVYRENETIKESIWHKEAAARRQADYEANIANTPVPSYWTPTSIEPLSSKEIGKNLTKSFADEVDKGVVLDNANTNKSTKKNEFMTTLFGESSYNPFNNPLQAMNETKQREEVLDYAVEKGLVTFDNGQYEIDQVTTTKDVEDYTQAWRNITGNNDITYDDIQEAIPKYNEASRIQKQSQQDYNIVKANNDFARVSFFESDEYNVFIDDQYNNYITQLTNTGMIPGTESKFVNNENIGDPNKYITPLTKEEFRKQYDANDGVIDIKEIYTFGKGKNMMTYNGNTDFNKNIINYAKNNADEQPLAYLVGFGGKGVKNSSYENTFTSFNANLQHGNTLKSTNDIYGNSITNNLGIKPDKIDKYTYEADQELVVKNGEMFLQVTTTAKNIENNNDVKHDVSLTPTNQYVDGTGTTVKDLFREVGLANYNELSKESFNNSNITEGQYIQDMTLIGASVIDLPKVYDNGKDRIKQIKKDKGGSSGVFYSDCGVDFTTEWNDGYTYKYIDNGTEYTKTVPAGVYIHADGQLIGDPIEDIGGLEFELGQVSSDTDNYGILYDKDLIKTTNINDPR